MSEMNRDTKQVLYYPTIEFGDTEWLLAAALTWDTIFRIVPESYEPQDQPIVKELEEARVIGRPIRPEAYVGDVAAEFMAKVESGQWDAAALACEIPEDIGNMRIRSTKVDDQLRRMLIARGAAVAQDQWLHVPDDFAALYMTYLARTVAEKNNLALASDLSAAWTGATYFQYDGQLHNCAIDQVPSVLAVMIVRDYIPQNISEIPLDKLLDFRDRRRYERRNFVEAVDCAAKKISECQDPAVAADLLEELKTDIEKAMKAYRKSADILNVKGWTGLRAIAFPALTQIAGTLFGLDPGKLLMFSVPALALGVVTGFISLKEEQKKLSSASDFSYLVHMGRQWQHCTHRNHDFNGHLFERIEEFVND